MGNKSIPDEVVTAMDLAKAAGWKVSNRNKMVIITIPDAEHPTNMAIGHKPNDESMKVFRATCRRYNLVGEGPARTPSETQHLIDSAEQSSLAEADRRNNQRKAYEAEQHLKQQQIEAARSKAAAATQQGLIQETVMTQSSSLFPPFDPTLLGTKDNTKFLLTDGTYYCVECWSQKRQETFKAPQGLAAHRGVRHQLYPGSITLLAQENSTPVLTQETSRVSLPVDVDTAFDMLRSAMADALGEGGDSKTLADKEAELVELRGKLEAVTKQADSDRKDFDKNFLESQGSFDKKLADAIKSADSKREAEIQGLMQNFLSILVQVREATETLSPIQAIAKIDTIVSDFLKK